MPSDVTLTLFELLSRELGPHKIVRDEERLERFLVDESGLGRFPAECAVLAESRAEVELVLRLAREHRVPVTPRGAGTGMTGGALPARGGIVLSTERMTRIHEIDTDDLVAVVEPGVITGDLQDARRGGGPVLSRPIRRRWRSCSLGGNVAENAGGPRAFKYGVTREYVLGLECVLMGGEVLRCGRRTPKGVDRLRRDGGDRRLRGHLRRRHRADAQAPAQAAGGGDAARRASPIRSPPAQAVTRAHPPRRAAARARAARSRDHRSPARAHALSPARRRRRGAARASSTAIPKGSTPQLVRCAQACEAAGAVEVLVAQNERERRDLWETRRRANPTLKELHRHKIAEDIVVPRGAIPEMLRRVDAIAAEASVPIATYGHAGDGNLHINLLVDDDAIPARAHRGGRRDHARHARAARHARRRARRRPR